MVNEQTLMAFCRAADLPRRCDGAAAISMVGGCDGTVGERPADRAADVPRRSVRLDFFLVGAGALIILSKSLCGMTPRAWPSRPASKAESRLRLRPPPPPPYSPLVLAPNAAVCHCWLHSQP